MALKFNSVNGTAAKSKVDLYEYKDGTNSARLVGDILARYLYWVPAKGGKSLPIECLSFDREKERFTNVEVDHVPKYFPDIKCQWSYTIMCIDPKDGKVKPMPLKKKLLQQIMSAASQLELDPTDPDTGFDVIFSKEKTGSEKFNVEYTLMQLKLKSRPLTDAERAAVAEAKTIDEIYPRQTPEEVKAFLEKITSPEEEDDSGVDKEAVADI
jgi:hypothetical protein